MFLESFPMQKFLCCLSLVLLPACAHLEVRNTTARTMPANASEAYPLTMHVNVRSGEVERETICAKVVVDGKVRRMRKDGAQDFRYEYVMPLGQGSASYYFDVDYIQRNDRGARHQNIRTRLYELELCNRYVLGVDSTRGTPGTRITVIGRGFTKNDVVHVGELAAETSFESPTSLHFFVPILPADAAYELSVVDETGAIPAGKLRVDGGTMTTTPRIVALKVGERMKLGLALSLPAPDFGLDVDITTDVPDAISADEVRIQGGRSGAAVQLEGLEPAQGTLYISIDGFQTLAVPLAVTP
jgi:hypothetical protein